MTTAALQQSGVILSAFHFSAAIAACDRLRLWERALGLLPRMASMRLEPNIVCCNAALQAAERGSAWPNVLEALSPLRARGLLPDAISLNTALSACRRVRAWRHALCLSSKKFAENQIVTSTCASVCESAGRWNAALETFAALSWLHVQLDQITRNSLLGTWGSWRGAVFAAYWAMDTYGYNILASSCEKSSAWWQACALIGRMRARQTRTDIVTWNTVIASESGWRLSLAMVHASGHSFSSRTFSSSCGACARESKAWRQSLQWLLASVRSCGESEMGCGASISACERGRRWREASLLVCRMPLRRLTASTQAANAAISAFARCGRWRLAAQRLGESMWRRLAPEEAAMRPSQPARRLEGFGRRA
ncbi:unnamed protein product [Effrenium voratum]|uniref:Pentatricopeptide repeat-containing protein, chloroplastic n=1 Tax=Effrenium voratum TaxID=2562239 RepID=A0AA36HNK7_9DINO|nr:unnamed protein product [Effrenium voratum]